MKFPTLDGVFLLRLKQHRSSSARAEDCDWRPLHQRKSQHILSLFSFGQIRCLQSFIIIS